MKNERSDGVRYDICFTVDLNITSTELHPISSTLLLRSQLF